MSGARENAIGALRLMLAAMVIFAHCPALLDGDDAREPLHWLFHADLTLGTLAVDGFFLLSGYLIAGSWISNPRQFFLNRVLRIYPAFVACSLLSLVVLAPFVGAQFPDAHQWARAAYRMVILQTPLAEGAFSGEHFATLNASMWTIAYEFRCYLLAALFGVIGLYRRPRLFVGLTLVLLVASAVLPPFLDRPVPAWFAQLLGKPVNTLRLVPIFMVGTCFRLVPIPLKGRWAAVAFAIAIPALLLPVAEIAFVLLGGYALFWVALRLRQPWALRLNAEDDISYGVYLYGWPSAAVLILLWPAIPLWALDLMTLGAAAALGCISWLCVEKPANSLKRLPVFAVRPAPIPAGPGLSEADVARP